MDEALSDSDGSLGAIPKLGKEADVRIGISLTRSIVNGRGGSSPEGRVR